MDQNLACVCKFRPRSKRSHRRLDQNNIYSVHLVYKFVTFKETFGNKKVVDVEIKLFPFNTRLNGCAVQHTSRRVLFWQDKRVDLSPEVKQSRQRDHARGD